MATEGPAQALKDRMASELKDYDRGRELYANRKFFEYEQATQNEKKIMGMVGQSVFSQDAKAESLVVHTMALCVYGTPIHTNVWL